MIKAQKEKTISRRSCEKETEIAQLLERIEEAEGKPTVSANPSTASTTDLQANWKTRRSSWMPRNAKKLCSLTRSGPPRSDQPTWETEKKRRLPAGGNPGIRCTVLAVNQACNFASLNLGGRQGVEPNTEMLVLRGGSVIGKIRISSVEPATAIGDIITSSLGCGAQVQPGDTVIYAGTNS